MTGSRIGFTLDDKAFAASVEKLGGVLFLDEDEYRRWAQQPAPPAGNH